MDIILLAAILISAYGIIVNTGNTYTDCFSHENTITINGIFVILVFLSHFSSYLVNDNSVIYPIFTKVMGQLIVAPFLFFSGYGVMKSIIQKGDAYIRSFGIKRIFRVWFHFAMAVCLYLVISLIKGTKYNTRRILLSFVGLSSIGNSNWFMFSLLSLYLITLVSGMILINRKRTIPFAVSVLVIAFMFLMRCLGKQYYYYDTAFAYVIGMFLALYEDQIQDYYEKNNKRWFISFLIICVVFVGASLWRSYTHWISSFIIWVSSFSFLLVLLSLKVNSHSKVLKTLGKYSFEIYILQRIPMNLLYKSISNKYLFFAACVIVTGVISFLFNKCICFVDNRVFLHDSKQ